MSFVVELAIYIASAILIPIGICLWWYWWRAGSYDREIRRKYHP